MNQVERELWLIHKERGLEKELDKFWHKLYMNSNQGAIAQKRRKKGQI